MTKRRLESIAAAAGTVLVASIVSFAVPAPAFAQGAIKPVQALIVNTTAAPVPVAIVGPPPSPLGVPLADHVALNWAFGPGDVCEEGNAAFVRMHPNGDVDSEPFVVPAGRTLVVTDVEAVIVAGAGNTFPLGRSVQAALFMSSRAGTGVFMSHLSNGVTITDETTGSVAVSSALRTGVLIGAGQQVCIRGDVRSASSGFLPTGVRSAAVRGYLF